LLCNGLAAKISCKTSRVVNRLIRENGEVGRNYLWTLSLAIKPSQGLNFGLMDGLNVKMRQDEEARHIPLLTAQAPIAAVHMH
jgi:hypothetical protein